MRGKDVKFSIMDALLFAGCLAVAVLVGPVVEAIL